MAHYNRFSLPVTTSDGVWSGGADIQPPQGHDLVYPDADFLALQRRPVIAPAPPFSIYFSPYNIEVFPPQNSRNMAAAASPANQDQRNNQYWEQTNYNMYYGTRRSLSYNSSQTTSSSSMLAPLPPAARGSSGPYATHHQNQHQSIHFHVPSDNTTSIEEFNSEEFMISDLLLDEIDYEEGVAILELDSIGLNRDRGSGLSEKTISMYLKTREIHQEDQNDKSICVVCQDEICLKENDDDELLIGTLDCGHEYHADCIKQWLKQKNICPLCKSTALSLH